MLVRTIVFKYAAIAAAGIVFTSGLANAATAQEAFHKAYFLDIARHDSAGAAKLYEKALGQRGLDADLRAEAEWRLANCREDIAAADLASLMPPDTFAYVEVGPLGEQVKDLLRQLGILAEDRLTAGANGPQVAISSVLVDELMGLRGAAVAINKIDPSKGQPDGVLVVHPGNLEIIRGLLESALPAGGETQDSVGGHPTFLVENEAYITLTRRLVIVSTNRDQIEGVVGRLSGKNRTSLADNESLQIIANARGKSLVSFFVDTAPIMPMMQQMIAHEAARDPELAMVNAMLDIKSIRTLSGFVGVSDKGVNAEVELRLDEGHNNIVYNLLRTNPIDPATLKSVPHGVAGFVVAGLSGFAPDQAQSRSSEATKDVVTGLDYGREIFANIAGIALFVMPPDDGRSAHSEIPDAGAAITVNDPSKSEAIWEQLLRLGCVAAGSPTPEGVPVTIEGVNVRSYGIEDHLTLFFTTMKNTVLVSTSQQAMTRAIQAQRGGDNVLDDEHFAAGMSAMKSDCTKALFVHPGRILKMVRPHMSEGERQEVAPFLPMLEETVASFMVNHSGERLRLAMNVTGIPQVGGVLSQMIAAERQKSAANHTIRTAVRSQDWDKALSVVDKMLQERPGDMKLLEKKFDLLAAADRVDAAHEIAAVMFDSMGNNATALNNFAWGLLTDDDYENRFNGLALKFSQRSNELDSDNWMFLDTLALAKFVNGDAPAAVELERKAIALAGDRGGKALEEALRRFESGLEAAVVSNKD
ncbi:MAG: hypothetical protein ACYTHJ_06380 [Planctomycetota bacterium]|jgi:Flp pilus assembly protein TadD